MILLVLCGSFNPPTLAHLRLLEEARHAMPAAAAVRGILSPVHDMYPKPTLIPAELRVQLCRAAVQHSDWIQVSDWEAQQPQYTNTLKVLRHFQQHCEDAQVKLVCGTDLLVSLQDDKVWATQDREAILNEYGIVCIARPGDEDNVDRTKYTSKQVIWVDPLIPNYTSSSAVRTMVSQGKSVQYLVTDAVYQLIRSRELYSVAQP
jgi:nicotinamide mononucleotide adenylyltransferase